MKVVISSEAKEDLKFHQKSGNKNLIKKIELLIKDLIKHPFSGIGKPTSTTRKMVRRIDLEHRLIYELIEEEQIIYIHRLKGHYLD